MISTFGELEDNMQKLKDQYRSRLPELLKADIFLHEGFGSTPDKYICVLLDDEMKVLATGMV